MTVRPQPVLWWRRAAGTIGWLVVASAVALAVPAITIAADLYDAAAIPHVGTKARDSYYQLFLNAEGHRAFAIAPGGAWAWTSERDSAEEAEQSALVECGKRTRQRCMLYAVDDRVTFSRRQWSGLWGPYASAEQAAGAKVGTVVGQRFPNLVFTNPQGETHTVARLRGKLALLHFWGSWCPPCARELPSLYGFYRILRERLPGDVDVVLLQMREPIEQARNWLTQQGIENLPLFDSGSRGAQDHSLTTTGNTQIPDRDIARVFPSSYVLDRNGVVIFSHRGPIADWSEYLAFFEDAARRTVP
jgi:thiol-disulfide isomerase/thioredoxin